MYKVILKSLIFGLSFLERGFANDIQVVSSLTDLESIVNSTWVSNSINRLMPPAKDCMYEINKTLIRQASLRILSQNRHIIVFNGLIMLDMWFDRGCVRLVSS